MADLLIDTVGTPSIVAAAKPLILGTTGANGIRPVINGIPGLTIMAAQATVVGAAAATISASNIIPAGSLVLGVTVKVTSTFSNTSLTSFTIGDGSDADRWGATIALTAGTQTTGANFTGTQPAFFASATSVVLTGTGANFAANGEAIVRVFYIAFPGV